LNKLATKGRDQVTVAGESKVIDTTSFLDNFIPDDKILVGSEAFDRQDLSQSLFFSIVFNALTIEADPVNNLFYPVVVMDSNKASATVTAKIANIMSAVKRDVSGRPVDLKKESIIKNLNNTKLFTLDSNRLYPVSENDGSGEKLLKVTGVKGLAREVEVFDGEVITTAPYKTNVAIDILGLAQSDALLAKGYMDETDSLNGALSVEKLYFKVAGKDSGGNDVVEYHARDIKGLPAVFTYTPTGHNKSMQLDYKTESLAWIGGKITKADGTPTAIADLADLPAGYVAKLGINLKGDADAQYGTVELFPVKIELVGVLDAAGNELADTDAIYTKVKAILGAAALEGYDLEAYANNTNARFRGKLLTTDRYTHIYGVPIRAKLRELTAVFDDGDDGDTPGLIAQIQFNKQALSKYGLLELINTATILQNVSDDTEDYGISSKLVRKASVREALDLTTIVNSLKSSDREEDIKSALKLKVKNVAVSLYINSSYNKTFEALYPGVKPTVIIGIDTNIGRFLDSFEDEVFKYEVAVSNDVLMSGNMFISFGVMGPNRNKEANPLNFGVCFWSPETVIAFQRQDNGKLAQETISMPRFKHQTLLPILGLLEVSGVEEVSGNIPVNTKAV